MNDKATAESASEAAAAAPGSEISVSIPSEEKPTASITDDFNALLDGTFQEDDDKPLGFDGVERLLSGVDPLSPKPAEEDSSKGGEAEATETVEGETATPAAETGAKPSGTELETEKPASVAEATTSEELSQQSGEDVGELRALLATQTAQLTSLQEQIATATALKPAEAKPEEAQVYEFSMPDELMARLSSEDAGEQKQGFEHLAQGIAQTVHAQLRTEYRGQLDALRSAIPEYASQTFQSHLTQLNIREDFYGAFPELNKPEYVEFIRGLTKTVWAEKKATAWTPELRNAIGERARTTLNLKAAPARANGGKPPGGTKPAANPPASANLGKGTGSASVPKGGSGQTLAHQVKDIL